MILEQLKQLPRVPLANAMPGAKLEAKEIQGFACPEDSESFYLNGERVELATIEFVDGSERQVLIVR